MSGGKELPELDRGKFRALERLVVEGGHRVVVSFGGGGLPGICGNLALAELLEQLDLRQHVEQIWGTSAGAIVGGAWASGASARSVLEIVQALDRRGSIDVQWGRLALAMLARPFGRALPDGIVRGRHFYDAIATGLSVQTFEECEIEFRCIAVRDDGSMARKVFRSGALAPSIFASMSLPGIVVPSEVDGQGYYDGGLLEKTPLQSPIAEHLRRDDGRKLLLIGTHFDNEANKVAARGFLARFIQTIYAMEDVAWHYQLAEARQRDDVNLLLLNPHIDDRALFDFSRTFDNFRDSFEIFADQLQDAKLGLAMGTV